MFYSQQWSARLILVLRALIALVFLLPLLWMASASLHRLGVPLPVTLRLLPAEPTLSNFARVWELLPMGRFTLNSLLVVVLAAIVT